MGRKGEELRKAEEAKRFTSDPLYKEAFETTREHLVEQLFNTPIRDEEGRDYIYITIKTLDLLDGHIKSIITTGKLANKELK